MRLSIGNLLLGSRRAVGGPPAVLSDGNTVAWFDYLERITKDGSNLVSVWGDKSVDSAGDLNAHNLLQATGTNQPIVNANGVLFPGVDEFMKCASFTLAQPEQIYIVLNQKSFTNQDRICDGNTDNSGTVYQSNTELEAISTYALGGGTLPLNENNVLNTYQILRILFNGASSKSIINETATIIGNPGSADMSGFTLGANGLSGEFGNIEVKEIIIRRISDTSINEQIIYDYLSKKYSI